MSTSIRSHTVVRHGHPRRFWTCAVFGALGLILALPGAGCGHVRASQRETLASPAMQFEMEPVAEGQRDSIVEITEGGTFPTAGPGTAGAGCGCN